MNPQYLQQQSPYYGAQPPNSHYEEPNANFPPKGPYETQSLSSQKSSLGGPPTSDLQHGQSISQFNQNNLVDQMSNVSLSGPQKPLSTQSFPEQTDKNTPTMPFPSTVNGINNKNHYQSQGESVTNHLTAEKSQQGSPTSPASSLPYGSSGQQYSGQPPNSGLSSGPNIPRNMPQIPPPINQNQMQNQQTLNPNRSNLSIPTNMAGSTFSGQQHQYNAPPSQQSIAGQPQLSGPPLPGQTSLLANQQNLSNVPKPGQNFQRPPSVMDQQILSRAPYPGQVNNMTNPLIPGQQNLSQNLSGPPMAGQQNFSGPPMPGQHNLSSPPMPSPQNLSGPPMPGQHNLSSPPMPSPQNLSGPPLPGQPNLQSQPPYPNQMPGQRRFPPIPGQQNNSPYNPNQGFQQANYIPGQPPIYGNQGSPYQGGMPSGPGGYPGSTQSQQGNRADPDQMPNPIEVFEGDQELRGGNFITNQKGLVPPLVTTKFVVHDQGNASPRFIRSTMYCVPTSADMVKHTQIPFSIILSPMAKVQENENEPPIVDMGEIGPVRCIRCKAYMSPFMQFVDAGRRFQCMFCKATSEVPQEYFQHLDHTGQRMDRYERPELMLGTYEYIATKDYCKNNELPKPPAIIFIIDVSYNNVKSGLVNLLCSQIKNIIRNLPVDVGQTKSNMKVGFITYNNSVHFYNCKANLAQPQMMYVGDVQDIFMPLLEGFLCDPEESESTIDSLMAQIPAMFAETRETETILGPAIQAGLEALKASECAGKLMVFHSTLPTGEAPGKLKSRDDRNVLGTEREKTVLAPQTLFYNNLGQECVAAGCSVDIFLFNNSYIDVATIGQVSRLTGGDVYKYTYFQADVDGERLITDIINNIRRPIAFDAVMRVRTSTGVRPTDFYGHLYMSNTTDMELASIDCDKAIAIEVKHDDKLTDEEGVYIQAALLYTSCSGTRRLRIINLSLRTSSQIAELYRSCDLDAMFNFLLKQSVSKLVESSPKAIKDGLNSRCATILAVYRKHCASPTNSAQLILPDCMKLLPLYTNSLLKSDALTGGAGITIDQKSYVMMAVTSMPIMETVVHLYPRLISLHYIDPQNADLPPMTRCSIERFKNDGAYLLENGIHMFLWLGLSLDPQWVQAVFGVPSVVQVDTDKTTIPILDNAVNKRVREVIQQIQSERRFCMRLTITRQREKMEMVMRQFLVEDQGTDGSPSYIDYLYHMYKEIQTLLS